MPSASPHTGPAASSGSADGPAIAELSATARALRWTFGRLMKDKNTKALLRRFWPAMSARIDGIDFELHPADNTTEFRLFMHNAFDERDSLEVLRTRVRGRRVRVFDIGANCGLYTLPLAASMGEGSTVHAFEPSPVMAARLERNVSLNEFDERVRIHRIALGADDGEATLNVHRKNHGQSSLRELDRSPGSVTVERRTLASFVTADERAEATLIKIDVEGREDDVLAPFLDTCSDDDLPDAILIEMVLEDSWQRDLRAALFARGYRIEFEGDGNALFERGAAERSHAAS